MIYFWILFVGISCILILPELFAIGMFFDGVVYATIARNMAENIGSFWEPVYISKFFQHPPLMYWLESLFFRVFGDHLFVEKLFSMLTGVIAALIIIKIWDIIIGAKKFAFYPLILWIITPITYWAYKYNMLENTLTLFCLLSVYYSIKGLMLIDKRVNINVIFMVIISSICILLGFFTKGLVSLFPLVIPLVYWLVYRKTKLLNVVFITIFQIVLLGSIFLLILKYGPANRFLNNYYLEQIMPSLIGNKDISLTILQRLSPMRVLFVDNLATIIVISTIIFIISYKKKIKLTSESKQGFFFFLLIAMSASFPIMLSSKQRGYYFIPSISYYALSLGVLGFDFLKYFINKLNVRHKYFIIFKRCVLFILILGIISPLFSINKIRRDHDILDDIYTLKPYIKEYTSLGVSKEIMQSWAIYAYMYRLFHNTIHLQNENSKYLYLKKGDKPINKEAKKVGLITKNYDLYID